MAAQGCWTRRVRWRRAHVVWVGNPECGVVEVCWWEEGGWSDERVGLGLGHRERAVFGVETGGGGRCRWAEC